ncbi:hypothetical protein LCGC14_2153710 [marine sediment metagenome]|uniref:Uncharacterized protein n=1 Tax=marine sediment metagenome TaxID=412755 RepID=A0A0F9G7S8_9ZZZZ
MSSAVSENKPRKISGYDRYDVEGARRTLKRAEEIKSDSKFLKVVLTNMDQEAVKLKKTADIVAVTAKKLRKLKGIK